MVDGGFVRIGEDNQFPVARPSQFDSNGSITRSHLRRMGKPMLIIRRNPL
jgi:hypothetical protein